MLKGNVIVGQSGGATAVINSSLAGVIAEALKNPAIGEIYGMLDGVQGLLEERIINLRTQVGTPDKLERLKRTPASALGMCRFKLDEAKREQILHILQKHNIRYFIYIGGNDSADTCHQLGELSKAVGYEFYAMGVPKTIDNDLPDMDHCPGYGSIARYLAISTRDSGIDTESARMVQPVKIIEVMGRNAGWVAASAALAKHNEEDAPHLIYTPERRLNPADFLKDVKRVYDLYGHCAIVIGETVKDHNGKPLGAHGEPYFVDSFGHRYFHGPANYFMSLVMSELGLTARFDKPGTLQRMSMSCASEVDLEEAWLVGAEALRLAVAGETDKMVTLLREKGSNGEYSCKTGVTSLERIANFERKMPEGYLNAEGNFVTQAFLDYARPLIGELPPVHFRLDRKALVKGIY
ncbi:MAG: 6-phosphofructokinase [Chloroflexota bacterium]|nr:6-phosphofructokinase [Chloroflexota bacterium]